MQQMPNDMECEDIQQWLGRGFFLVEHEGGREVCKLMEVIDRTTLYVQPLPFNARPAAERRETVRVATSSVWMHWPMCGSINTEHGALYVQRTAERQWRRVYSGRHVSIAIPWEWETVKRRPPIAGYNGDTPCVVRELFNPNYPGSLAEAVEGLEGAKAPGTVALNRFVVIDANGGVYYHAAQVGSLNSEYKFVPTCGERMAQRIEKYIEGGLAL